MDSDLRVYLHGLLGGEWAIYEALEWLTEYRELLAEALGAQSATIGGQLVLSGTAERGRLTVADSGGAILIDVDWPTMTAREVLAAGR